MTGRARGRTPRVQGTPGASDAPQPDQRRLPQKPSLAEVAGPRGDGFASAGSMASPSCGAEAEALCTGMGEIALSGFESSFYGASSVVVTRPPNIVTTTGFSGIPVNLVSNLFRLDRMTDFRLFQYHVDFKPDVPNKAMRKAMIQEHTSVIGKIFMFDGMILFLPIQLNDVTEVHSVHTVGLNDVKITLKLTNEIDPASPICMQLYNIIFKRVLSCIKLVPIGRNYYSPSQAITVHQHKLEVWPGFVTSILQFEKSVMLIADMSHKILNGTTVWSVMQELFQKSGFNNQRYRDSCAKKLVGEIVLTRYNNKTYRLDDIDWSKNPESVFATDKMDMSFVDYYSKHHHITIHDKKQPLLISMPKSKEKRGPIALVPELCYLTGLSEEVRSDFRVMKDISVHTRLGPQQRVRALEGLIARINSNDEAVTELSNWHLDFARTLLNITSRQLPPEQISLGSKKFTCDSVVADWSSEMRSQQLINPRCVDNWILMYTEHDKQSADDLVSVLYKVCPSFGMQVNAPKMIQLPNDNVPTLMSVLKTQMTADTNLVVCILPTSRKDRYDAVKMFCCIEHPVPSQLILSRTLMKKAMQVSVVTKLALQLNCKLGGELWTVTIPIRNLMIVGIDCYRDSSRRGHSVGALIASTNDSFTRFYSRCTFQSSMEDLMDRLRNCMIDALKAYRSVNGALPERLVIYRDGVGDGQLKAVHEQEVTQMKEIFEATSPGYSPKFAFIVVKKRIHSRFFLKNHDGTVVNPLPGTIVDTEATRPEWYDFFLVSQSVRQGTVSPTHYNVLHDSTGMKADHLQRLTYKLCHLYFNWPGTIRVPAPCQYAHKLAFLVGQTLHKDPSLNLSDRLFFL